MNMDLFDLVEQENEIVLKNYRGHQKKVVLPDTITVIGENAFRRCLFIEEMEIPSNVKRIEAEAFNGCHGLRKLTLCDGLREIKNRAFWYCSALREITFPKSVTLIGPRAFECCSNLRRVNLQNPGTHVDEYAFNETPYFNHLLAEAELCMAGAKHSAQKQVKHLILPEGLTHLDLWAFSQSTMESVTLPNSLRTIGMCAFKNCKQLKTVSMSPNTYCNYHLPLQPEDGIFYGCTALEEVILKGPLKNFVWFDAQKPELLRGFDPERTFRGCNQLKRIIAWEIPLSEFPAQWQRYAVNGFLSDEARNQHYSPEISKQYHDYLENIRPQLINRTEIDHSYALHQYLIEKRWIEEDEIELLLERASKAKTPDVKAALLSYQNEYLKKNNFLSLLDAEFLNL